MQYSARISLVFTFALQNEISNATTRHVAIICVPYAKICKQYFMHVCTNNADKFPTHDYYTFLITFLSCLIQMIYKSDHKDLV